MVMYLVVLPITAVLINHAGRIGERSRIARLLLCVTTVALMSFVAAVRDFSVGGPDTLLYGNIVFDHAAESKSFGEFVSSVSGSWLGSDYAYLGLNYVTSRFTGNVRVFYFVLSALNSSVILASIMLMRKLGSTGLMWFTYVTHFYAQSFNILRQAPALSFSLLAVVVALRGRTRIAFALGFVALMFHTAAIVVVPMLWIVMYLVKRQELTGKGLLRVLAVGVLGVANFSLLVGWWGHFSGGQFMGYLSEGASGGSAIGVNDLPRVILVSIAAVVVAKTLRGTGGAADSGSLTGKLSPDRSVRVIFPVLFTLSFMEVALLPLREIAYPMNRLMLFFAYVNILLLACLAGRASRHRWLANLAVIAFGTFRLSVGIIDGPWHYSSEILASWLHSGFVAAFVVVLSGIAVILLAVPLALGGLRGGGVSRAG